MGRVIIFPGRVNDIVPNNNIDNSTRDVVLRNIKENTQSQTDWDSNPRSTAHSFETPGKFLSVLDLNYPSDNRSYHRYERGRFWREDGYLGNNGSNKANEKVLPQTPNTSR